MSFLSRLCVSLPKLASWLPSSRDDRIISLLQGEDPGERDRLSAISALSRAVRNDSDSIEIYLALGNLYRTQGDIERAVQLRSNLIARPGLAPHFKAMVFFELGHDYKRGGFIDRALQSFEQARELGGDSQEITRDMARVHAESGNFAQAAALFGKLGLRVPQAHYLVRQAQDRMRQGAKGEGRKLLFRALKVYNGSIEARQELIKLFALDEDWRKTRKYFEEALGAVPSGLQFLLLDALLHLHPDNVDTPRDTEDFHLQLYKTLLPVIEVQPPEILLQYYGALYLLRCGDAEASTVWLAKTLVLKPDFWAARLVLLDIAMAEQTLSPVFKTQLEFFIEQARQVKKFICQACGLHRETTFFRCPQCHSWHSIAFRTSLQD